MSFFVVVGTWPASHGMSGKDYQVSTSWARVGPVWHKLAKSQWTMVASILP